MNIVNNVVFIPKKPVGYVFSDFYSPKCFLTLDQLNVLNNYEPVKRNSTDESPAFYYVSEKLYNDAEIALGGGMPAANKYKITDDFLSQTLPRIVDYLDGKQDPSEVEGRTNSEYLVGRIMSTQRYEVGILKDNVQYNLEPVIPNFTGYVLAVDHFVVLAGLLGIPL